MSERNGHQAAGRSHSGTSRRGFLGTLGLTPGLASLAGAELLGALRPAGALADLVPLNATERRHRAFVIRRDAAIFQRDVPPALSVSNGDEEAYANRIASFTKGLPHND